MKRLAIITILIMIISINFVSSAHYIAGYAEDALDGESSNNKIAFLWNPTNGFNDNLTDIIGVNGASNSPNIYMFDCESLSSPCQVGDTINIKIIDSGDNYVSNYSSIVVTGAGYDAVDNITLNSPPSVNITSPRKNLITNQETNNFNCSFSDLDSSDGTLSLYGNFSGTWELMETKNVIQGHAIFSKFVTENAYDYTCIADDYLVRTSDENQTIIIDTTKPIINNLTINITSICGNTPVSVICDTVDLYGIKNVTTNFNSSSANENITAAFVSTSFYETIHMVNSNRDVIVTCYSEDNAGNIENQTIILFAHSGYPDITIYSENILFSKANPIENEMINISANISNIGCSDANNFLVSFYNENNQIGDNETVSIPAFGSFSLKKLFLSRIGVNKIFVKIDSSFLILENNESNNIASKILDVPSWQEFYGNITKVKILGSSLTDFGSWGNSTKTTGNIFMADSESQISWISLLAIGKKTDNSNSSNDLIEIDHILQMENFSDSINNTYSNSNNSNFIIHKNDLTDVPIIQSTNNDNFVTGILWDSSDDTNGEYDEAEKEDIVFVAKINSDANGKYGVYDYEIKIPAKLREYDTTDTQDIYFYYELI